MDLQNPIYIRILDPTGPTRLENNCNNVFTRIPINKLRNRVFNRLMVLQNIGFGEDFTTNSAWMDIITEREKVLIRTDIGFGTGSLNRRIR